MNGLSHCAWAAKYISAYSVTLTSLGSIYSRVGLFLFASENSKRTSCPWSVYELAQAATTKYHRPGGLNHIHWDSSQFWRLGSPRSRHRRRGVCSEPLPDAQMSSNSSSNSSDFPLQKGTRELCNGRWSHPRGLPPCDLITSQSSQVHILGVGFNTWISGGGEWGHSSVWHKRSKTDPVFYVWTPQKSFVMVCDDS